MRLDAKNRAASHQGFECASYRQNVSVGDSGFIAPGWRNWQTQRTQNPPGFGPWGFDPPSRHQQIDDGYSEFGSVHLLPNVQLSPELEP
jgi:hypothetical protein